MTCSSSCVHALCPCRRESYVLCHILSAVVPYLSANILLMPRRTFVCVCSWCVIGQAERNNGRAAMLGVTGCLWHELLGVDALYPTGGLGGAAPPAIFS